MKFTRLKHVNAFMQVVDEPKSTTLAQFNAQMEYKTMVRKQAHKAPYHKSMVRYFVELYFEAVYFGCVRIAYTQWLNRKMRVLASFWSRIHIFHFSMNAWIWIWIKCSIYSWVWIFFFSPATLHFQTENWLTVMGNEFKISQSQCQEIYWMNGSKFDSKRNLNIHHFCCIIVIHRLYICKRIHVYVVWKSVCRNDLR